MSHPSANYLRFLSHNSFSSLSSFWMLLKPKMTKTFCIDWWIDGFVLMPFRSVYVYHWMTCSLIRFSTIRDILTQCLSQAEWHEECRWHNTAFFSSRFFSFHLFFSFPLFARSPLVCNGNEEASVKCGQLKKMKKYSFFD